MDLHLDAPFTIDTWDDVPDPAPPEPGAPATGRVGIVKTYTGDDLTGSSSGHLLTTQAGEDAAYLAQERVTGTLAGRRGSFVLQHGGTVVGGVPTDQWARVVVGSGTAALAGLTGSGTVAHELLTLDVVLPD